MLIEGYLALLGLIVLLVVVTPLWADRKFQTARRAQRQDTLRWMRDAEQRREDARIAKLILSVRASFR